jgi:hypothetical protein
MEVIAMTETLEQLEALLDDLNPETRRHALAALLERAKTGQVKLPHRGESFNMHCHSFFSYNGYGYSPSGLVWRGMKQGLMAMGLVDFDVLDGVAEFEEACRLACMPCGAGLETRVFVPEFADREINSPGEPGISYHMGMGFVPGTVAEPAVAASLRDQARARNERMVERVNTLLDEIALDYAKDVLPLTPTGNATERHVCAAYCSKAEDVYPDPDRRAAFWAAKLGMDAEAVKTGMDDPPGFQGVIRAKTMKRGGVGYAEAKGEDFPTADQVNRFALANGAIPVFALLDGTSSGEQCMDELLDVMQAGGVAAVNIIPDRNWNIKDPGVRQLKVAKLYDFVEKAKARALPIFVGTEMNAHGQRFVDDFAAPEMAPLHGVFMAGAWLLHAHTLLQARAGMGYLSPWAARNFAVTAEKNAFYEAFGRTAAKAPSGALGQIGPDLNPAEALRAVSE